MESSRKSTFAKTGNMDLVKAMVMVRMVEVVAPALPTKSREAAQECSPRRKPWVKSSEMHSPEGAEETHQACDTDGRGKPSFAPLGLGFVPPLNPRLAP